MRLLIIFTFITAQFLLSVQASEEMPDLYCGDKNCYEGKLFLFKINIKTSMSHIFQTRASLLLKTAKKSS